MTGKRRGNNTGLSIRDLALVSLVSVLLFLVFPSLLWTAGPNDSHMLRFGFSYLLVLPLVGVLLPLRRGHFRFVDFVAGVLIVWSVKMIVTVALYHLLVPGDRNQYHPPSAPMAVTRAAHYRGVLGFEGREVRGVLRKDGKAMAGWIVSARDVVEGKKVASATPLMLRYAIEGGKPTLGPRLNAGLVGTDLRLVNTSPQTLVLTGTDDGTTLFNVPLLPEGERLVRLRRPGTVDVQVNGGGEVLRARLVVSQNPYVVLTDAAGQFRFIDAPLLALRLVVTPPTGPEKQIRLEAGPKQVALELDWEALALPSASSGLSVSREGS